MSTEFKLDEVESALLTALRTAFANTKVSVEGISTRDFNQEGEIITVCPAVRLLFDIGEDQPNAGIERLDYNTGYAFSVMCGGLNLRGSSEERSDVYQIIATVRAALAGLRLELGDGRETEPTLLGGIESVQHSAQGSWYAQRVVVTDIAQFVRSEA